MTTLYPGARWRPLGPEQPAKMSAHDLIILHTMVGTLWGTDSYFMDGGYTGVESHFGVGFDGEVLQWTDLESRADANLDDNFNAISIETADMGEGFPAWGGSDVPAWTDAQIEAIAQIVAWCCKLKNIPCQLVPDSKAGRRGIAYHRQGVDSIPLYQPTYRVSGGRHWSTKIGKVCPGDRRVAQVPEVIKRASEILAGGGGDWFDMADRDDLKEALREVLNEGTGGGQKAWAGTSKAQLGGIQSLFNMVTALLKRSGVEIKVIKLPDNDAQFLLMGDVFLWIQDETQRAMWGLAGIPYDTVPADSQIWKSTPLRGPLPPGFPDGLVTQEG